MHVVAPLAPGAELALPEEAARHVQVRRLQPGDAVCLFDGRGGEWQCEILGMGKRDVNVRVIAHDPIERGPGVELEIAFGMPTNERMDALIEKATELGASALHPLVTSRSVLRLEGERAAKRVAHWQAVAIASSEQSGRTRVPIVSPVRTLDAWLQDAGSNGAAKVVLAPAAMADLTDHVRGGVARWIALSGPEGGLDATEIAGAIEAGYRPVSLGPLVLRADTAPLAWLAQVRVLLES
ncbi:MAG TPA: 16S rRNA (uracil(1498)-N(3))-methyltransferase [Burkholderiaceae bacterium]|nr:16S rRNA (uracil(1498)-N(3))-methyltransferase [Burkholderiaceae bacterium]